VLWQSLADRAKSRLDLLKNAAAKEQQIIDLEQELKQVQEEQLPRRRGSRTSSSRRSTRPRRLLCSSMLYPLVRSKFRVDSHVLAA
jgi:hypothetical protein